MLFHYLLFHVQNKYDNSSTNKTEDIIDTTNKKNKQIGDTKKEKVDLTSELSDISDIKITEKGKNKFLEISSIIKNLLNNGVNLHDILKYHIIGTFYSKDELIELKTKDFFEKNVKEDGLWQVQFDKDNWIIKFVIPFLGDDKNITKKLILKFEKPQNIYEVFNNDEDEIKFSLKEGKEKSYLEFKKTFEKALFSSGSAGDAISTLSKGDNSWIEKKIKPDFIEQLWDYQVIFNDEDQVVMIESQLVSEKELKENTSRPKKIYNYSFLKFGDQDSKSQSLLSKDLSSEYNEQKDKVKDIKIQLGELTKNNYLDFKTWLKVWAPTTQISRLFAEYFQEGFGEHKENQITFSYDEKIQLKGRNWKVEFDDTNLIIKVVVKYNKTIDGKTQDKEESIYLKFDNKKILNEKSKDNKLQIKLKNHNNSYDEFVTQFKNTLYSKKHISDALLEMSKGENAWFDIVTKFEKTNDEFKLEDWSINFNESDKTIALVTPTKWLHKGSDSDHGHYHYDYYYTVIAFDK
ncbi:hypothetical protein [[Mycoplasma] collis]|uniref:hypothetical protein n=1 Tax=[Mycoplasma] collis TaxID=2127 RepID=UPI00051BCEDB|nr:hypothetical protein [[Mycoplasma] collis]